MKRLSLLLFSLLFVLGLSAQNQFDTIFLKNDASILCFWGGLKNDSIFYRLGLTSQHPYLGLPRGEVRSVHRYRTFGSGSDIVFWERGTDSTKTDTIIKEQPFARAKNAVSGQIMGLGGIFSVGYDRVLWQSKNAFLAAGVGVGMIPYGISVPHYVSMNIGKKKHNAELGIGGTYMAARFRWDNEVTRVYGVAPLVGYRMQPNKGFFMRTYFTVLVPVYDSPNGFVPFKALPFFGVDLGYSF